MPETSARGERFLPVSVVTARYPPRSGRPPHGAAPRPHPGGSAVHPGSSFIPAPSGHTAPPRPARRLRRTPRAAQGHRHRAGGGTGPPAGRCVVTWTPGWWPGPGPPRPAPTWRHRRPPATALRRRRRHRTESTRPAPRPPRPCAGGGAAAVPAGAARGRCGERRCAAARRARSCAHPSRRSARAALLGARGLGTGRWPWAARPGAAARPGGAGAAALGFRTPRPRRTSPCRAHPLPTRPHAGLRRCPGSDSSRGPKNPSPGAAGTEVVPPPRPALPCPRAAPSALLPCHGRALTATLRSRRSYGAPDPRGARISHPVLWPGVSLPPPVPRCTAQPQSWLRDPRVPRSAASSRAHPAPHGTEHGRRLPRPPAVRCGTPEAHE